MDLNTKVVTLLTNRPEGADQSAFSRDGTLVAFHSGASVYVIGADGQDEKLVATGLDDFNAYFSPDFSADGSELVFDRNNEIDAVHLDGSAFRMIVQNVTTVMKAPAVSPSGNEVAYNVKCGAAPSIWVTPFSAKNYPCTGKRVTPEGEPDSERPAWGSNDLIAYERLNRATKVASIAIISQSAGTPCSLTPDDGADDRNPAWSP
jgi:Tol biopolymer transport system component